MKDLQAIVRALTHGSGAGAVLATLVTVEGSSYRRPGARLLVTPDGTRIGSISGGCLEEDVLARAQRVAATGVAEAVVYDTTTENDLVWGVGLGCHGVVRVLVEKLPPRPAWALALAEGFAARRPTSLAVTHDGANPAAFVTRLADHATTSSAHIFLETIRPPTALAIFGAGDDAQPLARLAKELGWHVTLVDHRPAYGNRERFPEADVIVLGSPAEAAAKLTLDADTVAVVMTHNYLRDMEWLKTLLPSPARYIGLLGPRKRTDSLLSDLKDKRFEPSAQQLARLYAPVGLDIGSEGPAEVAMSILSEIQAVLTGHAGGHLRARKQPIHQGRKRGAELSTEGRTALRV